MPVIYGTTSLRPAPQVSLANSYQTLGDGRFVGSTVTATLKGTIVADKLADTDTPHAIEQKLTTIIQKQADLRKVFSLDGLWFEIQGYDGSAPVKFIAIVDSIEFAEGQWVDKCDYTVVLHGETVAGEEGEANHIESASESWQYEEADGLHTYRASHTLQAKGKTYYESGGGTVTKKAWEWAKDFVVNKLTLDWGGVNASWSPKAGKEIFETGAIQPENSLLPFNRVITQNVDEDEGTYNVTENFFLSTTPYWEEYTVSSRKDFANPQTSNLVSINGVIHGLATGLHNPESKLVNSQARWLTVKTLLYSRASAYAPGITLNVKHTSQSVEFNVNEGTVSYNFEWNDRLLTYFEFYNVAMQTSMEDSKTTVTVDGSIIGERYFDDPYPTDLLVRYNRALVQWNISKLLIFTRALTDSGITDLQPFPVSATMTPNKQDGAITYSYVFDNRIPQSVRHDYTVSTHYSREDGRTVISIDGTITGLRLASPTIPFGINTPLERYSNANSFFGGISGSLIGLASTYIDVSKVNPLPFGKTVSHVPNSGQLTYQYEFNSNPLPCVAGSLSENITVTDDAATPVIAIISVLGRQKGPVMQQIGTVKEKRRSVSIEVVMPVDFTTNICSAVIPPAIDISAYAPTGNPVYLEQDQTQWSPSSGHLSRTVAWIYE
jgi:hypothetical protein